ncbi:MAG: hypothetical protein HFI73_05135 [Bacilli bacterium]|jgi:predicted secreted protein|nr:hypothetical protein [Bacilli bacterium]
MIKDNRSKFFVFVPFCLLSQAYQAQGIVKYEWKSSIKPFVQLLLDNDINIIQMPCAEARFNNNLIRDPMGLSKYDTKDFNEHCEKLATTVSMEIENILSSNYKVIAILGIEQSPSCCVNYIYTNHGNEKRKGLFIEKLYEKVKDYNIPIVGINRRYINKSLNQLKNIIENIAEIDK